MVVPGSETKRFGAVPTATGGIARLAYARALAAGLQLPPLLSAAGLTVAQIEDRRARLRVRDQIAFLDLIANELQDDFLGFDLAQGFELREVGLPYYVMASSETVDQAFRRAERYSAIVNDGIAIRYRVDDRAALSLSYIGIKRLSDRHQIEFWLTAIVRVCRQITSRNLRPDRVAVMHARKQGAAKFSAFLGCEVEFGADKDEVVFPASIRALPLVSADPYLNEMLVDYSESALAARKAVRGAFRPDVENAIVPLLPHGKVRAGDIARASGMSSRTLARRLASEGSSFANILEELRADLAKRYLQDDSLTISHIAWLLGYREVSAFTHAFKRWTGVTPRMARLRGDFAAEPAASDAPQPPPPTGSRRTSRDARDSRS